MVSRISQAIEKAENKTSAEFVLSVLGSSGRYLWLDFIFALGGLFLGSYLTYFYFWPLNVAGWISIHFAFAFMGVIFSWVPPLRRLFITKKHFERKVREKAQLLFFQNGVSQTEKRVGVLIFVSLFERRVKIIPDHGFLIKVPKEYWQRIAQKLEDNFSNSELPLRIEKTLEEISQYLSQDFPKGHDDKNELSDKPIMD